VQSGGRLRLAGVAYPWLKYTESYCCGKLLKIAMMILSLRAAVCAAWYRGTSSLSSTSRRAKLVARPGSFHYRLQTLSSRMTDIPITQLEAAINYWRARSPSHGDEMSLCPQASALSKPYALMIVQRRTALPLDELDPFAREALEAYESLNEKPV